MNYKRINIDWRINIGIRINIGWILNASKELFIHFLIFLIFSVRIPKISDFQSFFSVLKRIFFFQYETAICVFNKTGKDNNIKYEFCFLHLH